jgi:hypothetical protein
MKDLMFELAEPLFDLNKDVEDEKDSQKKP